MKISQSKTRDNFPLSTKKIIKKTIISSLNYIIFSFIIFTTIIFNFNSTDSVNPDLLSFMKLGTFVILGFLFLIILLNYLYQRWYFAVYFYDLNNDYIVIKKGPITPKEITIPYERIQDVYVDQDLLDRILGIYDVHISSATISSGLEAHIDGVEIESANGLRNLILETIKQKNNNK